MGLHEPYSSLIQDSCKWTNKDQTDRIAVARGSRRGREWAQTPLKRPIKRSMIRDAMGMIAIANRQKSLRLRCAKFGGLKPLKNKAE